MPSSAIKSALASPLVLWYRLMSFPLKVWNRLSAFAALRARCAYEVPTSTVVMSPVNIYGSGRIRLGEGLLLYPCLYMETHGDGEIVIGDGAVLSTGVHLVSYAGLFIGRGSMIGEYTSIRDANHTRAEGMSLRESDHTAKPIVIGSEVWIGRGVTVLGGVTIGDRAIVGANAVVTRDVPADTVVAGVPAVPIRYREGVERMTASSERDR
jgi:acetyltransferase-like isoleucine patch superfamily enzyme